MRFFADESCDQLFTRGLRGEKFDVLSVAEVSRGLSDEAVAELALEEGRLLLTEDRDFGHYNFAKLRQQVGVILFRYPFPARKHILEQTKQLVKSEGGQSSGEIHCH